MDSPQVKKNSELISIRLFTIEVKRRAGNNKK
jgi:hypothetical protein